MYNAHLLVPCLSNYSSWQTICFHWWSERTPIPAMYCHVTIPKCVAYLIPLPLDKQSNDTAMPMYFCILKSRHFLLPVTLISWLLRDFSFSVFYFLWHLLYAQPINYPTLLHKDIQTISSISSNGFAWLTVEQQSGGTKVAHNGNLPLHCVYVYQQVKIHFRQPITEW